MTWTPQQKLSASDGLGYDRFGTSVSLDGDMTVVGAPWDTTITATEGGSAYIFKRSGETWEEHDKLTASDSPDYAEFGFFVSTSEGTALVGTGLEEAAYVSNCYL